MSLPSSTIVRQRIDTVANDEIRRCLQATYLFAARISEAVAHTYKGQNPAYGKDLAAKRDVFGTHKVAVWTVHTAKRDGKPRSIALPLYGKYEPWAKPLFEYCRQTTPPFPFTRQYVSRYLKLHHVFQGLTYPIETYTISQKEPKLITKVGRHIRPFNIHALRHLRATELVEFYGFTIFELSTFCGWTLRGATGFSSSVLDRYLSLSWQGYFPKLLKRRVP